MEIDRSWQRTVFVAGLDGNLVARSELVNTLVGERVLDPYRRALGAAPLRLKRGSVMRYRVVRMDDTTDEKLAPDPESRDGDAEREQRASEARDELGTHETALATIENKLPLIVRERPPIWGFWLWPLRWLLGFLHRRTTSSWRVTKQLVADAKRKLASIDEFKLKREERERAARETYYSELRLLCGGGPEGNGVREVELTIDRALPERVELVELMGELRASADIDAVLVVERDGLYAPNPGGDKVMLGPLSETIPDLPAVLERARALTLARRAIAKLATARTDIEQQVDQVERKFQERIQKLAKLALPIDLARFRAAQLDRMRPMLRASVNAVMEHAAVHMGTELANLGTEWMAAIQNATTSDELKAAVAKIEGWPTSAMRIAEEVRVLVMGGAGGIARDLYAETVSPLRAHGLPEDHLKTPRRAPTVAPVTILDSLANPTSFTLGGNWFAGLFKSFDAKKADIREKVHARIEKIRDVAAAELLNAEPELHGAVIITLGAQLDTAIEAQQAWHQKALEEEHAAIGKEREKLMPLMRSGDALTKASNQLVHAVNALQAERPAVAAAAVAAAS
ncbi:MAG TPA: hypothetical protein VFV99_07100 [Kofleriaceae bacterium]|nr:hypothetical protein [Kofleriaceae bacterium]